ncbi:LEA type 2 family protein [Leptospira idonii]|uniref:Uncharacterized protein n=1 Tax=Leptospira idonii TaxID=1193500 RepID=A0A4R9M3K7_9LEPT|nr:LEA type 2 family protein [Leptospira idonii]TGN20465.1 hypothetical protein EHS15_04460 [Leptospira idonii]
MIRFFKSDISRFSIGIYFLMTAFTLSCVSDAKKNLDRLKKCKVELVNVEITLLPSKGLAFIPNLSISPIVEVTNPNEEDVEVYEFDLDLTLVNASGKEKVGKVKNLSPQKVSAKSSLIIPLQLDLEDEKGGPSRIIQIGMKLLSAASRGEDAEFEIEGNISFDTGLGKIPLPVSEKQTIRLKK